MLRFAVPIILGDLLQQCYNIADTVIVGRFLGADALAAVGSSFSLMTFLTSILLGLAMGSGTVFSIRFGQKDRKALKECVLASFVLLFAVTVFLTAVIFAGMFGIFLYNFFAALLRSLGNSVVPLIFLAVSAGLNIGLDLWFVAGLEWGVAGAAGATVISQYVSGIGIAVYTRVRFPELIRKEKGIRLRKIWESWRTLWEQDIICFGKRNDIRRPGEKFLKEECPYLLSDNGKAAAGCF